MLIKIIGGALIITGSARWGFSRAEKLSLRVKSLMALKTAFNLLEGEIIFSSYYLKYTFERVSRLCSCEDLFLTAAELIGENGAADAWKTAVEKNKNLLALKESDAEILQIFASGLGVSDREQQVKNIRHISSLLDSAIADARSEYDSMAKIYRSVGVLGGLFIFILLL